MGCIAQKVSHALFCISTLPPPSLSVRPSVLTAGSTSSRGKRRRSGSSTRRTSVSRFLSLRRCCGRDQQTDHRYFVAPNASPPCCQGCVISPRPIEAGRLGRGAPPPRRPSCPIVPVVLATLTFVALGSPRGFTAALPTSFLSHPCPPPPPRAFVAALPLSTGCCCTCIFLLLLLSCSCACVQTVVVGPEAHPLYSAVIDEFGADVGPQ